MMVVTMQNSVVLITSSDPSISRFGTGFVIHQDANVTYFLTCAHVVKDVGGPEQVKIRGNVATLIASGERDDIDLAVLRIEALLDVPSLHLCAVGMQGSPFIAIGFQIFGTQYLIRPLKGKLGEQIGIEQRGGALRIQAWDLKIEGDYTLQPGYSGSPLIDEISGDVLGVVSHRQGSGEKGIAISVKALVHIWPDIPQNLIHKVCNRPIEILSEHQKHIITGIEEQRNLIAERSEKRRTQQAQRVVGVRLLDVSVSFKNRISQRRKLGELLADPTTRLVSVIGRGGIGKTGLVSKVLADLEHNRWTHTDEYIPISGLIYLSTRTTGISLERLFRDCAEMLGGEAKQEINDLWANPQIKLPAKISRLLDFLQDELYIILLDNLEDLLDESQQLIDEELKMFFSISLSTPHCMRLLITSRIPMKLPKEVIRFDKRIILTDGLPVPDGIELLKELDVNGEFGLRNASEEVLREAVNVVKGVPRALELIVSILANDRFISLEELLQSFYQRDEVIADLASDVYKRLNDMSKKVMEALSVFSRPVPIIAIEFLLQPFMKEVNLSSVVSKLAQTYNVNINRDEKTIFLHPIDRDYIYNQLSKKGEYSRLSLERRAAEYYRQIRLPQDKWYNIDDIEPQLLEFVHLIQAEDYNIAAQLMDLIDVTYLGLWGYGQRIVSMREKLLTKISNKWLIAHNFFRLASAMGLLGNYKQATIYFKQSSDIAHEIGEEDLEIRSLLELGHIYQDTGRYNEALSQLFYVQKLTKDTSNRKVEWQAAGLISVVYRNIGQPKKAISYAKEALAIARQIGDKMGEGDILEDLGIAYRFVGDLNSAENMLQDSLIIAKSFGNKYAEARVIYELGLTYLYLDRIDESLKSLEEALNLAQQIDYPRTEGWILDSLGRAYLRIGDVDKATSCIQHAMIVHREIGNRNGEREAYEGLGELYSKLGDYIKAIENYQNALSIDRELGNQLETARHLKLLGDIYIKKEDYHQAIISYGKSKNLYQSLDEDDSVKLIEGIITEVENKFSNL